MAAFHFSYDLNYFHFIRQDFYHNPVWTVQRTCIVTLFLLCAGAGQAVAIAQGQSTARFWRRWAQVAGCAVLVTIGSWIMFPLSYISFGVLHGIAVMLSWCDSGALGRLALAARPRRDRIAVGRAGSVLRFALEQLGRPRHAQALHRGLRAGAALARRDVVGCGRGRCVAGRRRAAWPPRSRASRPLAPLGRWSLTFYMVHQPVLIGLLAAIVALRHVL